MLKRLMILCAVGVLVIVTYAVGEFRVQKEVKASKMTVQQTEKYYKAQIKDLENELLKIASITSVYNKTIDTQKKTIITLNKKLSKLDGAYKTLFKKQRKKLRVLKVRTTAYTYTGNRTATGTIPSHGQVAVDPKLIKLGSKLWIDGYGVCVATDTGGKWIQGNQVDLFMTTRAKCIKYGLKHNIRVIVLSSPK